MFRPTLRSVGVAAAIILISAGACDIPTETPRFTATPTVKAPLIFSEGLQFLGPGPNGEPALVDTTSPDFDSLFTVDDTDRSVFVVRDIDQLDLASSTDVFDPLTMGPAALDIRLLPDGIVYRSGGTFAFDLPDFELSDPNDFIELAAGTLDVENLQNQYAVDITELRISFPDVLLSPYSPADSLVVSVPPMGAVTGPHSTSADLAGARIHASGSSMRYNVIARTSEPVLTVPAGQRLLADVAARNLVPRRLSTSAQPIYVSVTTDANADGLLDVLSDEEARVVTIADLEDFYDFGLEGMRVVGAEIIVAMTTDVSADIDLIGTLVGVSRSGEMVYLEGRNANAVPPTDTLAGKFLAGGLAVSSRQLVRMSVAGSGGGLVQRRIVFDDANSNAAEFIANLPEQVRLVAQAAIGSDGQRVEIEDPFVLDADVSLVIPLAFRDSLAVTHEFEADLSSLDELNDLSTSVEVDISRLSLEYSNAIPFGVDVTLRFLDESGLETIVLPAAGDPMVTFAPAPSDARGFSTSFSDGHVTFTLDEDRLRALARSRSVAMDLVVDTGPDNIGRVRATDAIAFAMSGDFELRIEVGD